jgi:GDPmannose 4,6-dehydratase
MKIFWKGKNLKEKAYFNDKVIIEIDKKYFRPTEVDSLRGDYNKAKKKLRWKPKITIKQLIKEMISSELSN